MEHVHQLISLASRNRLVCLTYRKPQDKVPSLRSVEPYAFLESQSGDLSVKCWQVVPGLDSPSCWRSFRADRILAVEDGGQDFEPRRRVTLADGEVFPFPGPFERRREESGSDPNRGVGVGYVGMNVLSEAWYDAYLREVERCLFDGMLTSSEIDACYAVGSTLTEEQKRAAHAQVFIDVLQDVLLDGAIDDDESRFIAKMRSFLGTLGWAP